MRRVAYLGLGLASITLGIGCSQRLIVPNDDSVGEGTTVETAPMTSGPGDGDDEDPGCEPGTLFCVCDGGVCESDLECVDGVCGPGCEPGTYNCECDGGSCNGDLVCVDGICELPPSMCEPGTLDCECDAGMCFDGLACVDGQCTFSTGPYSNCGWDLANEWYACGHDLENPQEPIACDDSWVLVVGEPCPDGLGLIGCCDLDGNNWWCETQQVGFENCGG